MSVAPGPKAVAAGVEVRLPVSLHHLRDGLLDKSVRHRGYAKESFAAVWLGNFHALDWLGLIRPRYQLLADVGPVRFEVDTEFIDSHAVDSRCSFVALDPFQGPFEVLGVEYLCHQG